MRVRKWRVAYILVLFCVPFWGFSIDSVRIQEEFDEYKDLWILLEEKFIPGNEERYNKTLEKLKDNSDKNVKMLIQLNEHQRQPFQENLQIIKGLNEEVTKGDFHPYVKEKFYLILGLLFHEVHEDPAAVIQIRNAIEIIEDYNFLQNDLSTAQYFLSRIMITSLENYEEAIKYMTLATENAKECKDSVLIVECLYKWGNYLYAWDLYERKEVDFDRVLEKYEEALLYRKKSFQNEPEYRNFESMLYYTIYPSLSGINLMRGNRYYFDTISTLTEKHLANGTISKELADMFLLESIYESLQESELTFARKYFPIYLESSKDAARSNYVEILIKVIEAALEDDTNPAYANSIRKEVLNRIITRNLLGDWFFQLKAKNLVTSIIEYELKHQSNPDSILYYTSLIDTLHKKIDLKLWGFNDDYFQWAIDVKVEKNQEIQKVTNELEQERKFIIMSISVTILFLIFSLLITKLYQKTSRQSKELVKKKEALERFNLKLSDNNEDLQNLNLELGRVNNIINAKNVSLNLLNTKLDQTNKSLDMYARVIAHDLKSPLKTSSQLLSFFYDDVKASLSPENNEVVLAVNKQLDKTTELIQDILDFNRMKEIKMELEVIELNEVLADVKEIFHYEIEHNNTIIEIGPLPKAQGFQSLYKQLFLNLINNAIKYKKDNVPAVVKIESSSYDEGKNLISIHDNGIGIKEEDQSRIFGLFEKLHNNQDYEGYGIGLATCKKIVENLHGEIWVESQFNVGTTFQITLPKLDENNRPIIELETNENLSDLN